MNDFAQGRQAGATNSIKMLNNLCDDEDPEALNMKGVLLLVPDLTDFVKRAINDESMTFDNPKDSVSYVAHFERFPWWTSFPEIMSNPPESGEAISGSNVAFGCIKKAAKAGFVPAQRNLGVCYQYGICTPVDRDAALEWYQKAEGNGDTEAKTLIANLKEGKNASKIDIYLEAANRGDSKALATVARCYAEGDGVEQDYTKANEYWQKLADKGDPDALYRLGINYTAGIGVEKDREKGNSYFAQALDKDYGGGKYRQGFVTYSNLNDAGIEEQFAKEFGLTVPKEFYDALEKIDDDDPIKCAALGFCYASGQHDEVQNCQKAFNGFLRGAEGGDNDARWALGLLNFFGWGVKADREEAVRWLTMAADQGQVNAILNLVSLFYGEGVTNLGLKVLGVSGSDLSAGVEGITQTSIIGDFVKDNYNNKPSDYPMAAKYFEKALEMPDETFKEGFKYRLQASLAVCYLAMFLDEANKENGDETKCKEYVEKSVELTTTALEHKEPQAYFAKCVLLIIAAAAGNDVGEEMNRLDAELRQLADSGNKEAGEIYGLLMRMALAMQSMGIIEEMGMKYFMH